MSKPTFEELQKAINFFRQHGADEMMIEKKFNDLSEEEKLLIYKEMLSEES